MTRALDAAWREVQTVQGPECFIAMKFEWDETALRMWLPVETVRTLFPELAFEDNPPPAPDDPGPGDRARKQAQTGVGTRPSFTVQVQQMKGSVHLGRADGQLT